MCKVLIACEESQAVTIEMRKLGIEAYSCDIEPCSGGHPEWHLQQDVLPLLDKGWDMIIAFPPCTYLSNAGAVWFDEARYGEFARQRDYNRQKAAVFFMRIYNAPCDMIAIENPPGYMNTSFRKPDQIIRPWQFGHNVPKATCLWLKGLPWLKPTNIVDKGKMRRMPNGRITSEWYASIRSPKLRSKTFHGIAHAMAHQWGGLLLNPPKEPWKHAVHKQMELTAGAE